jgi:hypothetical protein
MTRAAMNCPVCGQEDCGLHDSVVSFTHFIDRCTIITLAALGGLIALAVAVANA